MSLHIRVRLDSTSLGMLNHRLRAAAAAGVARAAHEVARDEKRRAPKAFGQLANSIRATRESPLTWHVTPGGQHPMRYAAAVEYGTQPGPFPPLENIRRWLRVKRIEANDPSLSEAQLAFLVARGIHRRGMRPHPFIRPTRDAMEPRVHAIVREHLARALEAAS